MNFAAFLLPLLQELVSTVGPTVLEDINQLVGGLASQNKVPLTLTAAHAAGNPQSQTPIPSAEPAFPTEQVAKTE